MVIRRSTPCRPSAPPRSLSAPNLNSMAAVLMNKIIFFLILSTILARLLLRSADQKQLKLFSSGPPTIQLLPKDHKRTQIVITQTKISFQDDPHWFWLSFYSNSFKSCQIISLSTPSHVMSPSSLGRELNPSTIELRLLLHRTNSSLLDPSSSSPSSLKEASTRFAIFFGSVFFPKPQNCGCLLGGDAWFCATQINAICTRECAKHIKLMAIVTLFKDWSQCFLNLQLIGMILFMRKLLPKLIVISEKP